MLGFTKDVGIDLGTANTLVFMKGKGVIMREPSVVAVDTKNDTVKFVGNEAKEVIGRTPGSIVVVRPLKDGVITDLVIHSDPHILNRAFRICHPHFAVGIDNNFSDIRKLRKICLRKGDHLHTALHRTLFGGDIVLVHQAG